jgi:crotonobetainyl-CoA:carnitine CoA-transferase CaiB-like acyl-CoA transferase
MDSVLSDVLVIDLSRVYAGPYCTMMLGDLGAQVVKIERPDSGDDTRLFGPPFIGGESAYYLALNRNKQSITLDFSTPDGKEHLLELVKKATVLVENFRPGTLERKGLGYEALHAINPGLIYCSISGYGHTGPHAQLPGYDFVAQGESGLMSITGEVDGPPMPVGTPVSDITAGMFACMSILAALRVRDHTGKGQRIDISLLESAVSLLGNVASNYLISGTEARRYGNGHPNITPYQAFSTLNGHMIVACGNDELFETLCHALGRDDLATDERFVTNSQRLHHRRALINMLQEQFLQRDTADWLALLRKAGVPCGPIHKVSQVFHDPQIKAREFVWECEHPTAGTIRLVGSPMRLSETPPQLYKAPPLLGEDNEQYNI